MAVYANRSNTYRGEYRTNGGEGYMEDGGSGTTLIEAPNDSGVIERSLYIDNQGAKPLSEFIDDKTQDSSRTYIITSQDDTTADMTFDHAYINGVGHLALLNTSETDVEITIKHLHGDNTGLLHTSVDQKIIVEDSDSPLPASFRVYDQATIQLPAGKYQTSQYMRFCCLLHCQAMKA